MRRASTSIIPKTAPIASEPPCLETASREELIAMVRALSGSSPAVISPTPPPDAELYHHSGTARRPSNAFGHQSRVSRSASPLAPSPHPPTGGGDHHQQHHRAMDDAPAALLNHQKGPLVRVASSANIVMLHALDSDDDDAADLTPETTTASEQAWTGMSSTANTSVGDMPLDASVVSTPQGSIATALRRKTLMVPETVGPLSVYNQIGSGAVGDVYCALNIVTEDMRALKVVPRERVLYTPTGVPKEAAVQRALTEHSASIAQLYECIDDPASPNVFFVMELVGPNAAPLGAVDSATGALIPGSAAVAMAELPTVVEQLADGLSNMRKHLVAHGDIKLDNFLVTRPPELAGKPQIKIIDFGAANIATRRRALCANLEQVAGTPTRHGRAVAAARQLMGDEGADPAETPCCFNPPEALQMSVPCEHVAVTDDTQDMSNMSFTSAAAGGAELTPSQGLPVIATHDASPGVQRLPPAEIAPPDAKSDIESDYSDADAYASPFFQNLDKPEEDLDGPALNGSGTNDASVGAMMMQASLSSTLPSLFRRRTVAVTLRSPNHGPARNKATLKQLTLQQRRNLGRKTAQAGATAFAAPEVTQGSMPSPASDMWSVGVVLFCLVFQRMPFTGDSRVALEAAIVTDAPDFPAVADMSEAQRKWYPLVSQMLNKEPFARPNPAELVAAAAA